jgi:RimJ/RimL family protein N-acetyltransferase
MIEIKQTPAPDFVDFFKWLDHYNVVPDWWRDYPELAAGIHVRRIYFVILRNDEPVGAVWIDNALVGYACELHILFEKKERGKLVPGDMKWLSSILEFCFYTLKVSRVQAGFEDGRKAPEKFFRGLGFSFEGKHYDAIKRRNRLRHMVTMGLTKRFYEKMKEGHDGIRSTSTLSRAFGDNRSQRVSGVEPGTVHGAEPGGDLGAGEVSDRQAPGAPEERAGSDEGDRGGVESLAVDDGSSGVETVRQA